MREPGPAEGGIAPDLPYRRGVGALVFNDRGLVLVGRRIDTPIEAWQLPQGGIKKHELPEVALWRELREEIGTDKAVIVGSTAGWLTYDLPPDLVPRVWGGRFRGQQQVWFALRFTGEDADIDLAAGGHPEFDAWRWAPFADLPRLAIAFKRRLYEQLVAEFSPVVAAAGETLT